MTLDKIVTKKKEEIESIIIPNHSEIKLSDRDFLKAITQPGLNVIGEVKKMSPSTGILTHDYHPEQKAIQYEAGGASALSVLTDTSFFGGHMSDLTKVRQNISLPVLCKDFIIDERQIMAARLAGADAVLLIMRILSVSESLKLKEKIESLNMLALIEIFNEDDLIKAMKINPKVLMFNHRDLNTLTMHFDTDNLINSIPDPIPLVAASGITHPKEVTRFSKRINAILIGTALMKSNKPKQFIEEIRRSIRSYEHKN